MSQEGSNEGVERATPSVSVVIPAYKAEATLDRLFASLDAQTLPQDRFETVVVDDGSPDGTWAKLQALAATRPNLRIERIEPSGWASRPRNVGTRIATGDYILYMDADDTLFPDGLRASVAAARAFGSDVLSPKESKTDQPWWGMERWRENRANIKTDGAGIARLLPMMPHKLYRRAFLLEHGIVFPEVTDGRRVLWEDIWFNIEAYRKASVVSVLADVAVYRWHQNTGSISKSYTPRSEEFWDQLENLFRFIVRELADDDAARNAMLYQQFRDRVLIRFSRIIDSASPSEIEMALRRAQGIQSEFIAEHVEAAMGSHERARAVLLRQGRTDLMAALWRIDRANRQRAETTSARWVDGVLEIATTTTWEDRRTGEPARFVRRGDRVVRWLPDDLSAAIGDEVLDATDEIAAMVLEVWVRGRAEKVTWRVPAESTVRLVAADGDRLRLAIETTATIDPRTAAFGGRLDADLWDVWAETRGLGSVYRGAVKSALPFTAALTDARPGVAYSNQHGGLAIDLGQRFRSLVRDGRPAVEAATGTAAAFTLPLPDIAVTGESRLPVTVRFDPLDDRLRRAIQRGRIPAALARRLAVELSGEIVADASGARLEAGGSIRPGRYRLSSASGGGATVATTVTARVAADGRITFGTRPIAAPRSIASRVRKRLRRGMTDAAAWARATAAKGRRRRPGA